MPAASSPVILLSQVLKPTRLPQTLTIHLMRFSVRNSRTEKLCSSLHFPQSLDLGQVLLTDDASPCDADGQVRSPPLPSHVHVLRMLHAAVWRNLGGSGSTFRWAPFPWLVHQSWSFCRVTASMSYIWRALPQLLSLSLSSAGVPFPFWGKSWVFLNMPGIPPGIKHSILILAYLAVKFLKSGTVFWSP